MRTLGTLVGLGASVLAVASCGGSNKLSFGSGGESSSSGSSSSGSSGHGGASSSTSGSGATGASSTSSGTTSSGTTSSGSTSSGTGASGTSSSSGGGGGPCVAKTCTGLGFDCGSAPDGCGNMLDCGTCPSGQTCGIASPNLCSIVCTPKSCAAQGFDCGSATDGCGNPLDCGTCASGQTCGATTPNVCGVVCTPKTCAAQGFQCGAATNGCGTAINCGACPVGESCGVVSANLCSIVCTPKTCAAQGFQCGTATDGCGNTITCPACPTGESCSANLCGTTACTNLCLKQVQCSAGVTTSITGTVYAPNGVDPLPGVTVYVPNSAVAPFAQTVSCDNCASSFSGSPLVKAVTLPNGTFTITNMPVGANIPLVIQKGHWRRQFTIPGVSACVNTALPTTGASQIRMPRTSTVHAGGEGDIPLMAFVTGQVDALECVLRKVGIADSEFSDPTGTGRVRLYTGAGAPGASYSATTPSETALWASQASVDAYDMVYLACQGAEYAQTAANQQLLINYANAGGRVFAAHYNYVWLYDVAPFSSTATWAINGTPTPTPDPGTGIINTNFARGSLLAQWLVAIGASTTLGQVPVSTLRHDFSSVIAPSVLWLSVNDAALGTVPLHYTFDTPVGAANQCGRVLFSDFHAENATSTTGMVFPAECTTATTTMTPEEKTVEYMLFDLDDCVGP